MNASPQLRQLGETLGTEALGIDLARLDDETFAWIRRAFAEHPVLVFREQKLNAGDIASFGRRFGIPRKHALTKYRHHDYPEVACVTGPQIDDRVDWYGVKRACDWHTDSTYEPELPSLVRRSWRRLIQGRAVNRFADMRAAYDTLP